MNKLLLIYAVLAIAFQAFIARGYQSVVVPAFLPLYSEIYGENPALHPLTEFLLKITWLLYLPPILTAIGTTIGFKKNNKAICQHTLVGGMLLFLGLGIIHAIAIAMPLVIIISELK